MTMRAITLVYMQPFVQLQNEECYVVTHREVPSVTGYLSEVFNGFHRPAKQKYDTTTSLIYFPSQHFVIRIHYTQNGGK